MSIRVAIVGAGPAGTALALGLLRDGHEVTLVSDRTGEQIRSGSVMSSQITFESALEAEAALGISELLPAAPPIGRMSYASPDARFATALGTPARSLDQRVRVPLLMDALEQRGGKLVVRSAAVDDLELLARDHDLVVVSTGRGGLTSLFEVDRERSPYSSPQRVASLTYLHGMHPVEEGPTFGYHSVPGVGECFTCPALSVGGECDIVVVEGVPGGPLDCWDDGADETRHLEQLESVLAEHFEDEWMRLGDGWSLTDPGAMLHGRITPVVRRPVGVLPSGTPVLGMADVVVLNDPLTIQGSNNAIKSASFYLEAINAHEGRFGADWMEATFGNFWRGWARWATAWTNSWLQPQTDFQQRILRAAAQRPAIAETVAAGFDDARLFDPWWFSEPEATRFLAEQQASNQARFDVRDLRRALGQYATGVTVVTARDDDGHRWAMTANSFTSLSLNPPVVMWAAARSSPSLPAFEAAERFAVNVLASDQHHLSRQFSTSGVDKFEGVRLLPGDDDPPMLAGTVARFVCRRLPDGRGRIDTGDHVAFFGEIESYDAPGGEPLVFHSGFYRLATRHPDL
ncbi:MAG TPA: flavin reductase [Nocardioidaceae bacterium]|nr:flavin reductase [Nocardioidaceae bacterium]